MITVKPSLDRRHLHGEGQETWRTFDPEKASDYRTTGFRTLDSLDEHGFEPGSSVLLKPLRDVEVLTYLWKGSLLQEDASGKTSELSSGECRCSTVPRGSTYRTVNASSKQPARAIQFCIVPTRGDFKPQGDTKRFPMAERRGVLRLMVSSRIRTSSLRIHQNARVFSSLLEPGHHLIHELAPGRAAWVQVLSGRILLVDHTLRAGDGASLVDESAVSLTAQASSEILLFDLK